MASTTEALSDDDDCATEVTPERVQQLEEEVAASNQKLAELQQQILQRDNKASEKADSNGEDTVFSLLRKDVNKLVRRDTFFVDVGAGAETGDKFKSLRRVTRVSGVEWRASRASRVRCCAWVSKGRGGERQRFVSCRGESVHVHVSV